MEPFESKKVPGLKLVVEEGSTILRAEFTHPIGMEWRQYSTRDIIGVIKSSPFKNYLIYEDVLQKFQQELMSAPTTIATIGGKTDGSARVDITQDGLYAYLVIQPAHGGTPVTMEQITAAVEHSGVAHGIDESVIPMGVGSPFPQELMLAAGTPPIHGINGELVVLVSLSTEKKPVCSDTDHACDLRDLGGVVSVAKGTPLMRRIPPTPGQDGVSVKGKPIPHIPGTDLQFAQNLAGVSTLEDDPDLLVATIEGVPSLVTNGIVVENVMKLKHIDLSTGHVYFNGSLVIEGDVRDGMHLQATGDITIGGTIEGAEVECGRNLVVAGGIIGHKEAFCHVVAEGDIACAFAEHATMEGDTVTIQTDAIQCRIAARQTVTAGASGSRGNIAGGSVRATKQISAITLGSLAGIQTLLYVGVDPTAARKMEEVLRQIAERTLARDEFVKRVDYLQKKNAAENFIAIQKKFLAKAEAELQELVGKKKKYQKRLSEVYPEAKVIATKAVRPGVAVNTGATLVRVDLDQGPSVFQEEQTPELAVTPTCQSNAA